jgi:hypothetical protein
MHRSEHHPHPPIVRSRAGQARRQRRRPAGSAQGLCAYVLTDLYAHAHEPLAGVFMLFASPHPPLSSLILNSTGVRTCQNLADATVNVGNSTPLVRVTQQNLLEVDAISVHRGTSMQMSRDHYSALKRRCQDSVLRVPHQIENRGSRSYLLRPRSCSPLAGRVHSS